MKNINIQAIRIDGGTQARAALNDQVVAEYADAIKAGAAFPQVTIFFDGADHWLADGFHRYHAYVAAGKVSIPADLRNGTRREAVLFSLRANDQHGLRRSNADKRKAVETLLADDEWKAWSDRKIAEACGVGHPFVAAVRSPEMAQKQQQKRDTSFAKRASRVESDSTRSQPAKAPTPPSAVPPAPAPADEFGPDADELAAAAAAEVADRNALQKLLDSDDKLSAAYAEIKRLNAVVATQQQRINGLMNEKSEAIRAAKSWQRKFNDAQKAAA